MKKEQARSKLPLPDFFHSETYFVSRISSSGTFCMDANMYKFQNYHQRLLKVTINRQGYTILKMSLKVTMITKG